MRIYLLPPNFRNSLPLEITGSEFHYLIHVLRLKKDSQITGKDANGKLWILSILEIKKKSCILKAISEISDMSSCEAETTDYLPQDRPKVTIFLYICIPKGNKLKQIVKMATEIGVTYIVPVISKNCIPNISTDSDKKYSDNCNKYSAVIKEAVQQSGSIISTQICNTIPISLIYDDFNKKCVSLNKEGLFLFFHQKKLIDNQTSLRDILLNTENLNQKAIGVLIGAEGGLTDEECKTLLNNGFNPILLKSNILRTETAAIYGISVIQALS